MAKPLSQNLEEVKVWKLHWRRQLHRLAALDLPLLAVGAGPERKAPASLLDGGPLVGWPTAKHTPSQLDIACKKVIATGTRTGKDAHGLLAFDIDGETAVSWCLEHGCDPATTATWQIHRNTDQSRLKVAFRLSEDQQQQLGQLKTKHETKPPIKGDKGEVIAKGEAVELFHGTGQVIVLGQHWPSKGYYLWPEGMGPEALASIPKRWWDAALAIACDTSPKAATSKAASTGKGDWSSLNPCTICGRDTTGYCSQNKDGKTIRCFHGNTFSPPPGLRRGEEITDKQGTIWAFSQTKAQKNGDVFSVFVEPNPERRRNSPKPRQHAQQAHTAEQADPSRSEALKLGFTELLEQALVAIRAKDLDSEMEVRAEIMGRFKRSDTQITAALFRLLTEQETGKPAGSTISAEALDLDTIEGLDALMDGFIPANDLGLMYGAKGSGKTLAALAMGFAAIDGSGFLDHSKPAQQGPVLFIASDSGAPPLMAAMQDLGVADHPAIRGADRSFYVWAHSASQGMSAWCASINGCVQLLQFVKAKRIKLVLIDSAKTICAKAGISYLDNDSIAALLTFIKEAICPHTSVMILSHDGTEKGSHSGAKVWAEVPSIVHNIQQIPDAPQERLWRVVKNRMGSLRDLRYQVGEGGALEVCAGVETIQDATAAVIQVLTEATGKGVSSLSRAALVQEIGNRFRLAPKTVDNTLQRMARSVRPEICRVSSKRGHYKLSPRLAATVSPNNVSLKEEGQGKNLVRESDLVSTRGVGSGYSMGTQIESPACPQSSGVGYSVNLSAELESDPFLAREVEMDIRKPGLVEVSPKPKVTPKPPAHRTPSTAQEWVEAALAELRLAPDITALREVVAWIKRQPTNPGIAEGQIAAALERLQREDQEVDQLGLEVAA